MEPAPADELQAAAALLRCEHSFPVQPPEGTLWAPGPCTHCGTPSANYPRDIPERLHEPLAAVLAKAAEQARRNELLAPRHRRDVTTALGLARALNGGDHG
ncbi:hypothetical protein ACFFMN_33810 [Planobispora siamensis]|uniref:Uncharacterized protein n=1 Tax=Planobispora siamensis TaxID=936338 RepID=A0A8J3SCP9_9ACTN|nr:hypothetical protein [Planobispora siamensis]GIH91972.1 hypothetical protein Psi01_26020 [Planobispora siamensis]